MTTVSQKNKQFAVVASFAFLIVFILFSYVVKLNHFDRFDLNATVGIQSITPKTIDVFLSVFSLLGSFEITFLFLAILFFLRRKKIGIAIFGLFFAAHVIEIFGKAFLEHPGPPIQFFRYNLPFLFLSTYVQPGSSYPSGHALRMMFVFVVALFSVYLSKKLKPTMKYVLYILLSAITLLMLFSRVSLGEHWSTDVIGGLLLGLSTGVLSILFL